MEKLLAILKTALDRIRSNLLEKEADVKQAVVSPILRALDWDDSNPAECKCEYPVPGGSVDYALIRSSDKTPLVFIETKRLGGLSAQGEDQLLGYAFKAGAPLLILTDGNVWEFYLSMAEGALNDRCFYRAELKREKNISVCAQHFTDYLRKDRVVSGQARQKADERRQSNKEKRKARNAISGVWRDLLAESDELRELLEEAVESKCGTKPELDDVKSFLAKQTASHSSAHLVVPAASQPSHSTQAPAAPQSSWADNNQDRRIVGFVFRGETRNCRSGKETIVEIVKGFDRLDHTFMDRFDPRVRGHKNRLVARNRNELYDDPKWMLISEDLQNGWWIGVKLSNDAIRGKIQIACDVAGVKFGSELTLIER